MAAWVRQRDSERRFRLEAFQDAPTPPMTPELREACRRALHVLTADGRVLRSGRATLHVLEHTGYPRFARTMRVPPLSWATELGYAVVARNRRHFGRFLFRRVEPKR